MVRRLAQVDAAEIGEAPEPPERAGPGELAAPALAALRLFRLCARVSGGL